MAIVTKIPARISQVHRHSQTHCSLVLEPQKCPRFKPGQFLHLALDEYDPSFAWPESRVFSIASSPTRRDQLELTFVVKGQFTQRMMREVQAGKIVWLKLPYGEFTFDSDSAHPAVFIGGGTGITPFLSYLQWAADKKGDRPIRLFYGVKSPQDLLFKDRLDHWQAMLPHLSVYYFVEQEAEGIPGAHSGRLDMSAIWPEVQTKPVSDFYLSGPPAMIDTLSAQLVQKGVQTEKIHVDEWE
jgi:ferredoxin-NADP reductase